MEIKIDKISKKVAIFIALVLVVGYFIDTHLSLLLTKSDGSRFFYITKFNPKDKVKLNNYYIFDMKSDWWVKQVSKHYKTTKLTKKASCIYPHSLHVKGVLFYCDKKLIAKALTTYHKSNGQIAKLKHFVYNGVIPAGKIFFTGSSPHSYDSRYFGFIDKSKIIYAARPLL